MPSDAALVVDFAPALDLAAELEAIAAIWARVPPPMRRKLSRLVWLREDGEIVMYRAPEEG